MNKRNNKGFSLIELIVVVAIMAVLVGVLAPTYLTYVEKTRVQKDNSAVAEVVQAIKVAAADEKINTELAKTDVSAKYTIGTTAAPLANGNQASGATTTPLLDAELTKVIAKVGLTSNTVTSVEITADVVDGALKVTVKPTLVKEDAELTKEFTDIGTEAPAK